MKYLKRFNEELSPEFLRKYADNAEEKGGYHKKNRAPLIRAYADEVAAKEAEEAERLAKIEAERLAKEAKEAEIKADNDDLAHWKENIEKSNKDGVIKLELETGKRPGSDEPNYIGEFYPIIEIAVDMFNDNLDYCEDVENEDFWLTIFVKAVVTTEEGLKEMTEAIYEHNKNNSRVGSRVIKYREGGIILMAIADIQIILENGTFKLGPLDFYAHDDVPCDIHILDRPSSLSTRNAIIKEFNEDRPYELAFNIKEEKEDIKKEKEEGKEEEKDRPKFEYKTFYGVEEAIDGMFAKYGIGSKYGISYQDIYDVIKRTPVNKYTI